MSAMIRASVEWGTASRQWSVTAEGLSSACIYTRRFADCAVAARNALSAVTSDEVEVDLYVGEEVVHGDTPQGDPGDEQPTDSGARSDGLATALRRAGDEEEFDQGELWTDSGGQVHAIAEMTTVHLANTVLYLDRTAVDRLVWWYVAHELSGDGLPISPSIWCTRHGRKWSN